MKLRPKIRSNGRMRNRMHSQNRRGSWGFYRSMINNLPPIMMSVKDCVECADDLNNEPNEGSIHACNKCAALRDSLN